MGRTRKYKSQKGGAGFEVLMAQIDAIQRKQNELSTSVSNVHDRALTEALEDVLKIRGKSKQIEADVRFYTESFLKDEKTLPDLFDSQETIPAEYIGLLTVLNGYSKMRNDMDTLIKSIYRYINLRLGYPTGSGDDSNIQSFRPRSVERENARSENVSTGLPTLVGQPGNKGGNSKSRLPELVEPENVTGPEGSQGGSWWGRSRTRHLLRKKN